MSDDTTTTEETQELETLRAELATAKAEAAALQRSKAVSEAGFSPEVADMIPADAEPGEWLSKYGALLAPQGGSTPPNPAALQEQAGQARTAAVEASGVPPTHDVESQMREAMKGGIDKFREFLAQQRG